MGDYKYFEHIVGVFIFSDKLEFIEKIQNLEKAKSKYKNIKKAKNDEVNLSIYSKTNNDGENGYDVRIYSMPKLYPVYAIWSLVAEGHIDSDGEIHIYSQQDIIDEIS